MTEKPQHPASNPVPVAETTEEISDVISQLETHKKTVIVAIVGAAILLSLVIIFRGLSSEKHLAAAEAYSQAANSLNIEELDQVIADYPQSIAAGNALLTKSELQLTSGKSEDARISLLAFVEKYGTHPRYSQGLFAMGNLFQVGGDNDKAAKYYAQLLKEDPKSDLAPFAMIRQGDLLLAAGKTDEARQKYESIMPAYRGTSFFERIEEKIKLLKVEELPVVDAPKKPAPKPAKKPVVKTAPKTVIKAASKTPAKPAAKSTVKPAVKPAAKAKTKAAPKPAASPASDKKPVISPPAPAKTTKKPKEAEKKTADQAVTPAEKKPAPAAPKN